MSFAGGVKNKTARAAWDAINVVVTTTHLHDSTISPAVMIARMKKISDQFVLHFHGTTNDGIIKDIKEAVDGTWRIRSVGNSMHIA